MDEKKQSLPVILPPSPNQRQIPPWLRRMVTHKPPSYYKGAPDASPVNCPSCGRQGIKRKNAVQVGDGWFCKKCAPVMKALWDKEHPQEVAFPVQFTDEDRAVSPVVGDPIVLNKEGT